jgi:uncharacterized protein YndB with AHSA1/START domain
MVVCEGDVRPGGAYHYVLRMPDGMEFPFSGVYRVVDPNARLVHTQVLDGASRSALEALVTVTFKEQDGRTVVTETTLHVSREARDGHLKSGMEAGAVQSLNRMAALLQDLAGAAKR